MPQPVEKQVVIIYAGTKGLLDGIDVSKLAEYERQLYPFIESKFPEIFETIRTKKAMDKDTEEKLKTALKDFGKAFSGQTSKEKKKD